MKGGCVIGLKVKGSRVVPLSEVYKILEGRKKRGPLGYEQQTCYDYCERFVELGVDETASLIKELKELGIDEEHACALADILPEHVSQVMVICGKETAEDKAKQVIGIIDKYRYKGKKEQTGKAKEKKKEEGKKESGKEETGAKAKKKETREEKGRQEAKKEKKKTKREK